MSNEQLFRDANVHHQAGRLAKAEELYKKILQREPNNIGALHHLGLVAHQSGRNDNAAALIGKAIQIKPNGPMYVNLGLVFAAQGKMDLAVECQRQALVFQPNDYQAAFNLAVALFKQGKFAESLEYCRKVIVVKPKHPEAHYNAAMACYALGLTDEAVTLYRQTIALKPAMASAHSNLGLAWQKLNKPEEAEQCYRKAIALNPKLADAHYNLAEPLQSLGRHDEAIAEYRLALKLKPRFPEAHFNLGVALQAQGKLDDAIVHFRLSLEQSPGNIEAHNNLGGAYKALGKLDDAAEQYRRSVAIKPDYIDGLFNLGVVLQEQQNYGGAVSMYGKVLEIKPDHGSAHRNLASAYQALGQYEEAETHCRIRVEGNPNFAETHCDLASILRQMGRMDEAMESCRHAIVLKPNYARAYILLCNMHFDMGQFDLAQTAWARATEIEPDNKHAWALWPNLRKMTLDDEAWVGKARELLAQGNPDVISDDDITLEFSIGKYYDDTGQYDRAFAAYSHANAVKVKRKKWDRHEKFSSLIDTLISTYTAELIRQKQPGSSASERPVFIVGMPRSGTSLVEQIIASHPDAFGAGELPFWRDLSAKAPAGVQFDAASLTNIANAYEIQLRKFSATAGRVVDKMPTNFCWLGLITATFPNARIIHTKRNPIDTCLSVYFQNFDATHPYSYDLNDLAFYYRQYHRLMAHWRSVLPPDRFIEVPYESLTADQEAWSRRLIGFLGLEWDDRCLNFQETDRRVGTSSNWQVRQKIYQTSKERWRSYERHVAPLLGLLELAE